MTLSKLVAFFSICILALCRVEAIGLASAKSASEDEFVVILDPGHGGHDYGAIGAITNEKSINLAVGCLVRDILAEEAPGIKVIMTRDNDTFVTLSGRAKIANQANGDLFVSIHANSLDRKNPRHKTVAGASVYSLGVDRSEENLAVAMRENAVLTLEDDYSTTYEGFDPNSAESYIIFEMDRDLHMDQSISAASAIQSELVRTAGRSDRGVRQAGFLVLRATSMPAVLVELDFICNPTQEKYMASEDGRRALARSIANGICDYHENAMRDRRNAGIQSQAVPPSNVTTAIISAQNKSDNNADKISETKPDNNSPQEIAEPDGERYFRIQFLISPKILPEGDSRLKKIKSVPVNFYRHSGSFKYTVGRFSTEADAQKELNKVRKSYPDAFIITTIGSHRE